jgi:hypothetical protein
MNTMYIIKITRSTSGEVTLRKEVSGYTRAYNLFTELCDMHGYDIQENPMEGGYLAGGHSHDFIIELYEPSDDNEETQYEPF